ncbi:hypothetical protein [Pseudomonas syringae]|uniref:hypothetical protein n=1 Tax=Pseudomonas syringae TaxID=317 RepID=UPI00040F0647|nr:hypothetical protein [Pseudomonas syringae]
MESFNLVTGRSFSSTESHEQVIFNLPALSASDICTLNDFGDAYRKFFTLECRTEEGEKFPLPDTSGQLVGSTANLKISKLPRGTSTVFFTISGLRGSLKNDTVQRSNIIYLFFGFSEFSSQSCNFKIWSKDESADDISRTLLDPRNFIRDSTGGALVEHLKFWALRTKPNVLSEVFRVWEEIAIPCSSLIFCTEVWKKNLALNLIFSGPQKLEIEYDQKIDKILFDTLKVVESTSWILDVDREVEIRHNFFSSRIASERRRTFETWPEFFNRVASRVLENSKNDYKAHLHSKSSETLKAIADLRKIIAEESSKIIDRTHALTSTLFRDIAIAIGTVSIKILAVKEASIESSFLLLFSALWLAASLSITISTNRAYIISLTRSRFLWNKKVDSLIPLSEFKDLSTRPFKDAVKAYNRSRSYAITIYASTMAIMILMAISQSRVVHVAKEFLTNFFR